MSTADTEMKVLRFPTEIKQVDVEARTFEGLASTPDPDLQNDIVEVGAFRGSLSAWRKGDRVIPLLDSHDMWSIRSALGKLVKAEAREAGLWTRWKVVGGEDGDGALARIEDGIVDAMSIGYRATKWTIDEDAKSPAYGIRTIHELDLKEVSLVMFPANPGARISAVKYMIGRLSAEEQAEIKAALAPPPKKDESPESAIALQDRTRLDRLRLLRAPSLTRRRRS